MIVNDPSIHSFTLIGRNIVDPIIEKWFWDFNTQKRKGKYANFWFKDDLVAKGTFRS